MDWFEKLTGFRETSYDDTRARLAVEGSRLISRVNNRSYGIGVFETPSLAELRERAAASRRAGHTCVSIVQGEARAMHAAPQLAGALFQVASQFNALEMTGPEVTPEQGVTRYEWDHTQGPACAIAAGAATIWRNYFVPIAGASGQTSTRQIDNLADLGTALRTRMDHPEPLWRMRNGYALCSQEVLGAIAAHLATLSPQERDVLAGLLRIAVHSDVEVTDGCQKGHLVSQAFCSALPIAYTGIPAREWRPFAALVLDAAYEATLLAGLLNTQRGSSNIVLLTQLGGGAFGNEDDVILAAMKRAIERVQGQALDIRVVSYGPPSPSLVRLVREFG